MFASMRICLMFTAGLAAQLLLSGCAQAAENSPMLLPIPEEPLGPHRFVVISDLHMGVGRLKQAADGSWTDGNWHPTEDFRWSDEFDLFVGELLRDPSPTVMLIAGDFLELWQSAGHDCGLEGPDNSNLGCTVDQALVRLERVIGAHAPVLASLLRFVTHDTGGRNQNQIVIVPGNHDAALVFAPVAERLQRAFNVGVEKIRVESAGYWLSGDGQILVEHGHQIVGDVNRFPDINRPAACLDAEENPIDCNGPETAYLLRSTGEDFVQDFYNSYEELFSVIDNLSSERVGITLGLRASPISDIFKAATDGLTYVALEQTWDQAGGWLGEQKQGDAAPKWDRAWARADPVGFIVGSYATDSPVAQNLRTSEAQKRLAASNVQLTDILVDRLCALREALFQEKRLSEGERCPTVGQNGELGAIKQGLKELLLGEDVAMRDHLYARRDSLPDSRAAFMSDRKFRYFIYGHTHKARREWSPFLSTDSWKPLVFNSGAWQRVATENQLNAIIDQRKRMATSNPKPEDDEIFVELRPEDLPTCYTYVLVKTYHVGRELAPKPELRYWVNANGRWRASLGCR